MWNDGPAKQPWLNYFNEYELQHCCFGGDGEDGEGGGEGYTDEAYSTSRQGTSSAATSAAQSAASAADAMSGQNTAGGVGIDDAPDSLTADQAAAAAAAADAAAAAGLGGEAQQAAADAVAAEEMGIDIGDVAGGLAGANVSMQEIDALEDLGLIGYNERTDLGYFDKLDADVRANAEAKAAQVQADLRSRPGLEDEVVSINPVTGDFEYSSFAGGLAGTGQGLADLYGEFGPLSVAKRAAEGFIDMVTGLPVEISDVISSIAKEKGKPESEVTQEEINAVTSGVGPGAGIGEFTPSVAQTEIATGLPSDDLSYAFAAQPGRELTSDDLSYAFAAQPPEDPIADQRGYGDAALAVTSNRPGDITDITDAQLAVGYDTAFEDYSRAMAEAQKAELDRDISAFEDFERGYGRTEKAERDKDAPSISPDALSTDRELSYVEGVGYIDKGAVDDLISGRDRGPATYDFDGGIGRGWSREPGTEIGFDPDLYGMDPEDLNVDREIAAFEKAEREAAKSADINDQAQMFGGGYATESGRRDAMNAVEIANMISAYEDAENAMFGGGYARTGVGSPVGSDSAGDDPIILPKKKKEEEEKPKSAMAQYFERLGVPSPYAPSTTQSASPYLSAVASQPAGAPEDLFARMARIRRQEALKTPRFNYAGFAPFSPNLYAAAYGISPEEARRRIPALPKLKQTIGFPDEDETTEAYGGGGLRNLIRRQTGGAATSKIAAPAIGQSSQLPLWREDPVRELQKLRIAQLGTAPQTAAERQALQKQKGFYRDEEGYARDSEGNVQENFGLPEGFPIGDEPKTLIDDEIKTMFLTTEDKPVLPIDVQEPGDPLYEPLPKIPDDVTTLPTFQPSGIEEGTGGPMIRPGGGPIPPQDTLPNQIFYNPNYPLPEPTGLQGLQQNMDQAYTSQLYGRPAMQQQSMGQNLQPFGMQSPAPFGTQQLFSSGFGQQLLPNFNTYSDIRSANSYNPAMGIK